MDSFWVALGVVAPMALLMLIGGLCRKAGIIERDTMKKIDKLLFRLFMPVLLFRNICHADFQTDFSVKLMGFVLAMLMVIFIMAWTIPKHLVKDHNQAASIGQGMIRSNYILFGIAVTESIYGDGHAAMVALLDAVVVPLTNALSVIILEVNRSGKAGFGKIFISILKNPMVMAGILGVAVKLIGIPIPSMLMGVIDDLADVTTTLSFISLGVSLNMGELKHNRYPLTVGLLLRMVLIPLIFLPISVAYGFRNQELCALMILFAAPCAVASYPMAVAMGADGPLSGQLVVTTTLTSILTMFLFTFLFRSIGLL